MWDVRVCPYDSSKHANRSYRFCQETLWWLRPQSAVGVYSGGLVPPTKKGQNSERKPLFGSELFRWVDITLCFLRACCFTLGGLRCCHGTAAAALDMYCTTYAAPKAA